MKLHRRHKITIILSLITAALAVIVFVTAPDQIITGYASVNGVESITYLPKLWGVITMVLIPVYVGVIWNVYAKRYDKRIADNPELQSLRLHRSVINILFPFLSSFGIMIGIINIIEWIRDLI